MERILSILLVASTTTARKVIVLDDNEWDSVVVSSDPIKITNSRFNPKNNTNPKSTYFRSSRNVRSVNDCEEGDLKCLYDNQLEVNSDPQDIEKFLEKYSSITNVKVNNELRNTSSKSYWNQIESQKHNHPYDDTHGWVTLDPIPWSTSKISKWKPNNQGERPWMYGPSQQTWASRPSASWGLGSNDIVTDNKPNDFPLDSFSHSKPHHPLINPAMPQAYQPPHTDLFPQRPQSVNNFYIEKPHSEEYQFTQRPQHTLVSQTHNPSYAHQPPTHSQFPQYFQGRPQHQWQNKFNNYPTQSSTNSYQNYPSIPRPDSNHPSSYPESGQGEWVLLSTTKGYSVPQRYHDRKMHVKQMLEAPKPSLVTSRSMKSKYQENPIEDKFMMVSSSNTAQRKSDNFLNGKPLWYANGVEILDVKDSGREAKSYDPNSTKQPEQELTFRRKVRLTVLPALNNTSTITKDGMLEVDASPQTVDEAQREQELLKKLQSMAVINGGMRQYNVIPIVPKAFPDEINKKKAAMIAAVGAGMIPATMAVLLPAALGRRRRSLDDNKEFTR